MVVKKRELMITHKASHMLCNEQRGVINPFFFSENLMKNKIPL
ncbi:hypothetical protein ACFCZI_26010 [Peribacillus butanolivorans]